MPVWRILNSWRWTSRSASKAKSDLGIQPYCFPFLPPPAQRRGSSWHMQAWWLLLASSGRRCLVYG